jgi:peptide chain release factor subunit 1
VLGAIGSAVQRLKLFNKVPPNGLVIYCGTVMNDEGKEKQVTMDFEPYKPINTSLYMCDSRFHTECLSELLEDDDKMGFIIMDGNGSLFGTLQGSARTVLHKFSVDLPKKHGRGGQSALRFARLRLEKRHNYLRMVAEMGTKQFINPNTSQPNIKCLVLAGSADFKNDLARDDLFDPRLKKILAKVCDVSYGGENGFSQAIEAAADALANVKFVQEKKLICSYFDEIAQDTGKYCFGVKDTLNSLEMGAVETLLLWDEMQVDRYELVNPSSGDKTVEYYTTAQAAKPNAFKDAEGVSLDIADKENIVEWFANNYKQFGTDLQFVTDRSQEGSQFTKGFGGIGGLLRWQIDFSTMDVAEPDDLEEDFM